MLKIISGSKNTKLPRLPIPIFLKNII